MRAKWSPAHTASSVMTTAAAAADLDPLPEPQPVPDVPSTAHQDAKEESDAGEVTSQKSDEKKEDKHEKKEDKHEKKEDKQEKKEDKHEKKEDKHEEKEDKHEEKTESNDEETLDGSSSQDQEPIPSSSAAVEPTPVPEIAQAKEAPQALCSCVGIFQWPSKDNQTPIPNVYLRVGSSVDVTKTQLIQVFGSSSRSIVNAIL